MRTIKTVQWNIGGGKIRPPEANPLAFDLYTQDGLGHIIDFLRAQNPDLDIITLQETHKKGAYNQTQEIAEALGYGEGHWINDDYDESHIEKGFRLGQGIISRFPIVGHEFDLFTNPNLTTTWKGRKIPTHDKGVTSASLYLGGGTLLLAQTLHAVPFYLFDIDPPNPKAQPVLEDMEKQTLKTTRIPSVLLGDFNVDAISLRPFLPKLFEHGFDEIEQHEVTRPLGKRSDHVMFSGMIALSHVVHSDALTDHFPVTAELAFNP